MSTHYDLLALSALKMEIAFKHRLEGCHPLVAQIRQTYLTNLQTHGDMKAAELARLQFDQNRDFLNQLTLQDIFPPGAINQLSVPIKNCHNR